MSEGALSHQNAETIQIDVPVRHPYFIVVKRLIQSCFLLLAMPRPAFLPTHSLIVGTAVILRRERVDRAHSGYARSLFAAGVLPTHPQQMWSRCLLRLDERLFDDRGMCG